MADMNELLAAKLMSEDDHDGFLGGNGLGFLIIILLFFFVFGGNGFGGWGNNANGLTLSNLERDVLNNRANLSNDILASSCSTQKEILQSNYNTLLGFKDQAMQMAACCCDIKQEVLAQNQLTRDLIQSQYIDGLRTAIVDLKSDISNRNQNEFLLSTLGNWYIRPPVNPCTCYGNYGYNGCGSFGCGCN